MSGKSTLERFRGIDPIEDLFFKRRTVFKVTSREYCLRDPNANSYEAIKYQGESTPNELDADARRFLCQLIDEGTVTRRLTLENCTLHLARHSATDEPAGFYWSVHAEHTPVWHDSFRVPEGSGLVFNAYVASSHRRQGVYRLLQSSSHNHLVDEAGCDAVFTIVENRNAASMRANEKFGLEKNGKNYLIKFLSINIFSVIEGPYGQRVYFVLPKGSL